MNPTDLSSSLQDPMIQPPSRFEGDSEEVTLQVTQTVQEIQQNLQSSPEVMRLAESLDYQDAKQVMQFGQETAVEISKFSDQILSTMNSSLVEDSGRMMKELSAVMNRFDSQDFEKKQPKGILAKIFAGAQEDIQKLLHKYQTLDQEINKIYVEIKRYENEIGTTNQTLDQLFEKNIEYYENLEKYIAAGNVISQQLREEVIPNLQEKAKSEEQIDILNLQNAGAALEMIEQRVYDLELAKMVALQTAPQIKLIQKGNYNLLRKIGSAFVITIPVFKTGLIQAIAIKRQKIQADAMKALDEKTNEMLLKNAKNISMQSVDIAKLTSSPSIKVETLEQTFQTIMDGISETMQIEADNRRLREEGRQRLLKITEDVSRRRKLGEEQMQQNTSMRTVKRP